jgi:hypothetical protein
MDVNKLDISLEVLREEILAYLREHRRSFTFDWDKVAMRVGNFNQSLDVKQYDKNFTENIYEWLKSKSKLSHIPVTLNAMDERYRDAFDVFQVIQIKLMIFEEITRLIRLGILVELWLDADMGGYGVYVKPGKQHIILTEEGKRFLDAVNPLSFEAYQYLNWLRQTAEPDDELQAYLSEGLACLQSNLPRAAAVLLRVALEHILTLLNNVIVNNLPDDKSKKEHWARINRHRGNIEDRAEEIFKVLTSSTLFLGNQNAHQLRNNLDTLLRPTFHAIRILGGDAAHPKSILEFSYVKIHYDLFATVVFKTSMEIINYVNVPNTSQT